MGWRGHAHQQFALQKLADHRLVDVPDAASAPGRIRAVHLLGARFIGWLLLPLAVPHDALIGAMGGLGLGLWHALLAAVFSALILHTFEIVFLGHRANLFKIGSGPSPARSMPGAVSAFQRRKTKTRPAKNARRASLGGGLGRERPPLDKPRFAPAFRAKEKFGEACRSRGGPLGEPANGRDPSGATAASPRMTADPERPSRRSRRGCRSRPDRERPPRRSPRRPHRLRPGPKSRGYVLHPSPWS